MATAERAERFLRLLQEHLPIEPELANGPVSEVIDAAFLAWDTEKESHGMSPQIEVLQEQWGKKILGWWALNIHSGAVKTEYFGDETDGFWECTYEHGTEKAKLKIQVTNGFIDSPKIEVDISGEDDENDANWGVNFNNHWVESIEREIYHVDPEHRVSPTREKIQLYHAVPQFLTKPAN